MFWHRYILYYNYIYNLSVITNLLFCMNNVGYAVANGQTKSYGGNYGSNAFSTLTYSYNAAASVGNINAA